MNTMNHEFTAEELAEMAALDREARELQRSMAEHTFKTGKRLGWLLSVGGLLVSAAFLFWLGTTGTAYWWKLVAGGVMLGFGAGILGLYARQRWAFSVLGLATIALLGSWAAAIFLLDQ